MLQSDQIWKIDINGSRDAVLRFGSTSFPTTVRGPNTNIKTNEDLRSYFVEGDAIVVMLRFSNLKSSNSF